MSETDTSEPLIARRSHASNELPEHDDPVAGSNEPLTSTMILLCGGAGIPFFLFGYDTGVVSGAMILIRADWGLDDFEHSAIVSSTTGSMSPIMTESSGVNGGSCSGARVHARASDCDDRIGVSTCTSHSSDDVTIAEKASEKLFSLTVVLHTK